MDGESFAGERFAFYSVPSLRYITSIAAVKAPPVESGISCVDPEIHNGRLPFQQETGQALKKIYGEKMTLLTGKECSERKLAAAITQNQTPTFLHIGAHGNFYPGNAMDSAIFLSADEGEKGGTTQVWNAKAMATVDMSHLDLITLSSCESGLTDPKLARDVFGIHRALFFAGAKRIVAPLWVVQDQSTAEFMQAFHHAYFEKQPAVLSLQRAQHALMKTTQYHHPYYWSAFVLTGAVR
jgi:CHAT domain-containing protein